MPETLEPKVRDTLRKYVREVKTLPNEAARRSRFGALIAELFPGTIAVTEFSRGIEKLIRIERPSGEKKGRADAYYGNAIIEFEKSLAATLAEAKRQLSEYVAGTWQREHSPKSLLAIASDGIEWKIYRPMLPAGAKPTPEGIHLEELRTFELAEDTLGDFWLWLTSVLFRPQQIEPTAERFRLDFGTWSPLYREGMASLRKAWSAVGTSSEAKLAYETWQKYLTNTYGHLAEKTTETKDTETGAEISEMENLFLRHTYLASIARLLIWAALSQGKESGNLRKTARDVFSGQYFRSKRLANLVDDDFFHWIRSIEAEKHLAPNWERILSLLAEYDLSQIREDVLKGVYQQLIDPKDRHDLGEYYTPDWLCERMVSELLPSDGYKAVLDPSCGSGSFLRAVVTHLLKGNQEGTPHDRLRAVLANVHGIDIHPVAVTISRATYVLALGKLVTAARKPIQIPVYLADALFLPHEVEATLLEKMSGVEIRYGGKKDERKVVIPDLLVQSPDLFDAAVAACTAVAEEYAKTGKGTRTAMEKHLAQFVPDLEKQLGYKNIVDALWSFTSGLAELIREKKNSIWSFIIRNSYRPAMFKGRFDFIIGNPPWLSYRYISDPEYQEEITRRAVTEYKIAPKSQKLRTQMELATVFLAHCMAVFANAHARLAFVMPRSVLNAEQHQNLILRKYSSHAKFRLTGYWDLREVAPLFKVPASVLFAKRDSSVGAPEDKLSVLVWRGKLPARDINWQAAHSQLTAENRVGQVIYLGSRAALSTESGDRKQTKPSRYQKIFKNGATIYPRNFFFVSVPDLNGKPDAERQYSVRTDPEQAKDSKPPYREVKLEGMVEGRFLFSSALAKHVLPFGVLNPSVIVLPAFNEDGSLSLASADELAENGYLDLANWMREADRIWAEKRGAKSGRKTLLEWLDYQSKLTSQNLKQRHLVLYNAGGKNVAAAYFDRETCSLPFVVDHKLYWAAFNDPDEAHYVAAILNAESANRAIKPFQSLGLLGERDIHKKLLDVPFPIFNKEDDRHTEIAKLGSQTWKTCQALVKASEFRARTISRQRAFIRKNIQTELSKIDKLVSKLLETT